VSVAGLAMAAGDRDAPAVVRLLRETIVQLCRSNAPFGGGRVEVDGIICISGSENGQQLVVKVHEVLHDAVAAQSYPGVFDRRSTVDQLSGTTDGSADAKRRRLELDGLPMVPLPPSTLRHHQSALYDYLSRFGLPSSPRLGPDMDGRFGVKDLSLKSGAPGIPSSSMAGSAHRDSDGRSSPPRRPGSPPDRDPSDHMLVPRHHQRLTVPLPSYSDRWSPSRPIPAIPQCFVCGYRFSSAEALGEHNETVHSIFTCLCCFKTFTSRSNLERHSRLHTGHRPYACPVCGKTFSRKDHLSNHATKHAYKCGTCTRRCSDQTSLAEHYRVEHPGIALAAVCAYCNKGFSSVELYEEHVKVHPQFHVTAGEPGAADQATKTVRHQCQMCGFEAMDRVCLVQHQQLMHYTPMSLLRDAYESPASAAAMMLPRLDQTYCCVVCGFTSNSLFGLRQHEASHAFDMSGQPHSAAGQCSRGFETTSKESMTAAADGCSCDHCGQRFDTYTSLCQHVQKLSGVSDEVLQHRDKRKQKQPRPSVAADAEDEDVNVVSPASTDDKKYSQDHVVQDHAVKSRTAEVGHSSDSMTLSSSPADDGAPREIRMGPISSIMNRSSLPSTSKVRDCLPLPSSPSPPPLSHLPDEYVIKPETESTPPRLLKRECSSGGDHSHDLSYGKSPTTCVCVCVCVLIDIAAKGYI